MRPGRRDERRPAPAIQGVDLLVGLTQPPLVSNSCTAFFKSEYSEHGKMLLRLCEVAEHQIGLADVLVGAAVLRVDGERLLVDRHRAPRVAGLARAVAEPIVGVGVAVVAGHDSLEETDRGGVVAPLHGLDAFGVHRVLANRRLFLAWIGDDTGSHADENPEREEQGDDRPHDDLPP
jgi:hypothetical protein